MPILYITPFILLIAMKQNMFELINSEQILVTAFTKKKKNLNEDVCLIILSIFFFKKIIIEIM